MGTLACNLRGADKAHNVNPKLLHCIALHTVAYGVAYGELSTVVSLYVHKGC